MSLTGQQKTLLKEQFLDKYTVPYNLDDNDKKLLRTHTNFDIYEENRRGLCAFIKAVKIENDKLKTDIQTIEKNLKIDCINEFYDDYYNLIENEIKMGIIELAEPIQPIKIDLDFKSFVKPGGNRKHLYTKEFIDQFIYDYMFVIQSIVATPQYPEVEIFLLEKPEYIEDTQYNNNSNNSEGKIRYKDGVHIQIPQILISNAVQQYIRHCYLNKEETISAKMYNEMNFCIDFNSCLDQSVMGKSGWYMYGSGKPNNCNYVCHKSYSCSTTYNDEEVEYEDGDGNKYTEIEGFEVFGICSDTNEEIVRRYEGGRKFLEALTVRFKYYYEKMSYLKDQSKLEKEINKYSSIAHITCFDSQKGQIGINEDILAISKDKPDKCFENVKYIEDLVMNVLNKDRAEDYIDWINLGWCLKNISTTYDKERDRKRLFQVWDNFSKQSPKYRPGVCQKQWEKFGIQTLGIGSLKQWARQDNIHEFEKLNQNSVFKKIDQLLYDYTDFEIATTIKVCYGDMIVCTNQAKREWYFFQDHKWNPCDGGFFLKQLMSTDFWSKIAEYEKKIIDQEKNIYQQISKKKLKNMNSQYNLTLSALSEDLKNLRKNKKLGDNGSPDYDADNFDQEDDTDNESDCGDANYKISNEDLLKQLMDKKDKLKSIKRDIQTQTRKECFLKACLEIFYDKKFKERLDQNKNLLCFNNGVYDFKNHIFRDGMADDYISKSTNINYVKFNPDSKEYTQIQTYLEQVFINSDVRKYMIEILSTCLCNVNQEAAVFFLYGVGSNSKSVLMNLVQKCFGQYYTSITPAIFTDNNTKANTPSPDIYMLKGARIAVAHEMKDNAIIQAANFKKYSGNDTVTARQLHKDIEQFTPLCRIFCTTNSYIPFSENTHAIYRRLKVIPFYSKFVKKEMKNPKNKNEHAMDTKLEEKMEDWPEQFMSYLIETLRALNGQCVEQPKVISDEIEKYRESQDLENIKVLPDSEVTNDHSISATQLYTSFKAWVTENRNATLLQNYKLEDIKQYVKLLLCLNKDNIKYYKQLQYKTEFEIQQDGLGESENSTIQD